MRRIGSSEPVLNLLLKGLNNGEIAKELRIAERTVKGHISRLFLIYGIDGDEGCARIRLAVAVTYEHRPDLIPFAGGDRAESLGCMSAQTYIRTSSELDAKLKDGSETGY